MVGDTNTRGRPHDEDGLLRFLLISVCSLLIAARTLHAPEGARFAQFGDGRKEFARVGATARGVIGFKPFFEHVKREQPDQVRERDDALFRSGIEPGPVSDVLFRPEEVHGTSAIGKVFEPFPKRYRGVSHHTFRLGTRY